MDKLAQLSLPERHGVAMTCIKHVRVKLELLVLKSSFGERVDDARLRAVSHINGLYQRP